LDLWEWWERWSTGTAGGAFISCICRSTAAANAFVTGTAGRPNREAISFPFPIADTFDDRDTLDGASMAGKRGGGAYSRSGSGSSQLGSDSLNVIGFGLASSSCRGSSLSSL